MRRPGGGQLVTAFDPHPDIAVNTLLVSADGTHLYAGGVFNNVRGCSRCDRLAMLEPATGVPLSWNPGATGTRGVLVAAALPAGLAIGGDFQRTNGVLHRGFALFPGTA